MCSVYRLLDPEGAPPPDERATVLLVSDLSDPKTCDRALAVARRLAAAHRGVLMVSEAAAHAPDGLEAMRLDVTRTYDVKVLAPAGRQEPVPPRLLSALLHLKINAVGRIDETVNGAYRRPRSPGAKHALFIFPGIFLPPKIGSHQRAMSTLLDLIAGGYDVDVMVKRSGQKLFDRTRKYFELCAHDVFAYEGVDGKKAPSIRRRLLQGLAAAFSQPAPPPTIVDKEVEDANHDGRNLLAELVGRKDYELIMVSFPWMVRLLDGVDLKGAKVVCDAHDVVSNRTRDLGGGWTSVLSGAGVTPERERRLLSRCDAVLAISDNDKAMFEADLGLPNVRSHPLSYYVEDAPSEGRLTGAPLRYGFIGSDMEANRRALRFALETWWPEVERLSPDSTLLIAGAITRSKAVAPYFVLRRNVEVAGFVEDIDAFFGRIDVLLSPALVQAGVNVKNVEALLRRRIVVATPAGARAMTPLQLTTVCEDAASFRAMVERIEARDPQFVEELERLFAAARARHAKPRPLSF